MCESKRVELFIISALILTITLLIANDLYKQKSGLSGLEQTSMKTFCDKRTGVEYLVLDAYHSGGITVSLNEDGTIKRCTGE
jgi:hypothetical protein